MASVGVCIGVAAGAGWIDLAFGAAVGGICAILISGVRSADAVACNCCCEDTCACNPSLLRRRWLLLLRGVRQPQLLCRSHQLMYGLLRLLLLYLLFNMRRLQLR